MELTLSQLHDLEVGDKVWVKVEVAGEDKGTYDVEVLGVDLLDDQDPVAVRLPGELVTDLGILDIIKERSYEYAYGGFRYWVENFSAYDDGNPVKITAVEAPTANSETAEISVVTETVTTKSTEPVENRKPLKTLYMAEGGFFVEIQPNELDLSKFAIITDYSGKTEIVPRGFMKLAKPVDVEKLKQLLLS